jgi:hypothetical protein
MPDFVLVLTGVAVSAASILERLVALLLRIHGCAVGDGDAGVARPAASIKMSALLSPLFQVHRVEVFVELLVGLGRVAAEFSVWERPVAFGS